MKSAMVVDTSIVIKWVLDEPDSTAALALLAKWINEGTAIYDAHYLALAERNQCQRPHAQGWGLASAAPMLTSPQASRLAALREECIGTPGWPSSPGLCGAPLNSKMGFQLQCGSQTQETFAEAGRGKPYPSNGRPGNGHITKGISCHVAGIGH